MARYAEDRVTELPKEQLSVTPTLTDDVTLPSTTDIYVEIFGS